MAVRRKGQSISLLPEGTAFQRGALYELTYLAKDPLVGGLGFAGLRDVGSFLRNAQKDDAGTANPLAGSIQYVYTACQSQPCRTMHDYLWLGFNEDESGKKVVDGMQNWIGGATGIFVITASARATARTASTLRAGSRNSRRRSPTR